jgi:hypothetical protein
MNFARLERLAPWSGVVAVVLFVVSAALLPFDFMDEPDSLASSFADDTGRYFGAAQLAVIAGAALLWFSGTLASALLRNGAGFRLAGIARAGGTAAATLSIAGAIVLVAGALRADEDGSIAPEAATVVADVGLILTAAAMPVAAAVLVGATAVAALRTRRILPTWLAWVSIVLTLALIILPINFIAVPLFGIWVLVVSGLMITGRLVFGDSDTATAVVINETVIIES